MELICTSEFLKNSQEKKKFRIRENVFQSFRTKFLSLLYMISLPYRISHCLPANHYPELRCVICTGVTLFASVLHVLRALVLHLNCTALCQSESSTFFMCIIRHIIVPEIFPRQVFYKFVLINKIKTMQSLAKCNFQSVVFTLFYSILFTAIGVKSFR